MGTLTFQATAGGSVNLLGPNISGTVNLTLPSADGTSGQPLQTNGSGTLSFANLAIANGGTGVTSFTANQIHYGSFSQSANLTFNGTTLTANTLNLTNALGTAYGGTGLTSFTANGVVYASSTSALATGSAFVFDGTNVGIGTSSPGEILHIYKASGDPAFRNQSSTGSWYLVNRAATSAMEFLNVMNGPITFYTNSIERMRIESGGNVGIGSVTYSTSLTYDQIASARPLQVVGSSSSTTIAGSAAALTIANSDTTTSNTAQLNFAAVTGASPNLYSSAVISCVFGARTNTVYPSGILTFATSTAAAAPVERLRINSSGDVLVTGTGTGSLGYGTGSGGTVTQATSRTTGVTLSKPTGAITMFSAAGSVVAATFTVTNTLVAATDTIILNQKSGTNLYVLLVTAVAAGSFNITFYTTGGVATDAPVINFAIIKGATS